MFRSGLISKTTVFSCTCLFMLLFVPAIGQADVITDISLIPDGSVEPPGDRVQCSVLLFPDAQDARLELVAFVVSGPQREEQERVRSRNPDYNDGEGLFRMSLLIREGGKTLVETSSEKEQLNVERVDCGFTIPYSTLELPEGEHLVGYVAILTVNNEVAEIRPSALSQFVITDKVRKQITSVIKVQRPVAETTSQEVIVWDGDKMAMKTATFEEQRLVSEVKTKTFDVNVPGEFHRTLVYTRSGTTASKEFVPQKHRTVYFATNRNTKDKNGNVDKRFGDESVLSADKMSYGKCIVSIPINNHTPGNIETPGRWMLFWRETSDPKKHFLVELFNPNLSDANFLKALSSDDILVYVHGYNNTFKDAVLRSAQMQHDLRFGGKVVAFSWPSAGSTLLKVGNPFAKGMRAVQVAYRHDEEQAKQSPAFLAELLGKLLDENPDRKVHVLAHSMGNRVLLNALHLLNQKKKFEQSKLGEVILAAADINGTDYSNLRDGLLASCERITYYFSSDDGALKLSQAVHSDKPIGLSGVFHDRMDTISARGRTSVFHGLAHLYASDDPGVLTDLRLLITKGLGPKERRPPLGPQREAGILGYYYWTFGL